MLLRLGTLRESNLSGDVYIRLSGDQGNNTQIIWDTLSPKWSHDLEDVTFGRALRWMEVQLYSSRKDTQELLRACAFACNFFFLRTGHIQKVMDYNGFLTNVEQIVFKRVSNTFTVPRKNRQTQRMTQAATRSLYLSQIPTDDKTRNMNLVSSSDSDEDFERMQHSICDEGLLSLLADIARLGFFQDKLSVAYRSTYAMESCIRALLIRLYVTLFQMRCLLLSRSTH
jgi:hypothetical protein